MAQLVRDRSHILSGVLFIAACIAVGAFLAAISIDDGEGVGAQAAAENSVSAQGSASEAMTGDQSDDPAEAPDLEAAARELEAEADALTGESQRANEGPDSRLAAPGTILQTSYCVNAEMVDGDWVRDDDGNVVVMRDGVCRVATNADI